MFGSTYNGQFEDVEAVDKMIGAPSLIWLLRPLCLSSDAHAQAPHQAMHGLLDRKCHASAPVKMCECQLSM